MHNRPLTLILTLCLLFGLSGCGPDNIFLRSGLDTPSHHVESGNRFMNYGKYDAAQREFKRAIELDPNYSPAYVGVGLATGYLGNPDQGLAVIQKAIELAQDEDQKKYADAGREILQGMVESKE